LSELNQFVEIKPTIIKQFSLSNLNLQGAIYKVLYYIILCTLYTERLSNATYNLHHHPSFHHPVPPVGFDYVGIEFSSAAQLTASVKLPCIYNT